MHPFVLSPWGTDILVQARTRRRGAPTRRAGAIAAADYARASTRRRTSGPRSPSAADPERIRRIVWYAELDRFVPERADPGFAPASAGRTTRSSSSRSANSGRTRTSTSSCAPSRRWPRSRAARAPGARRPRGHRSAAELEASSSDLGLTGTRRLRPRRDGPSCRRSSPRPTCAVSLARSDSTPASLLEAMASGLPAVCGIAPSIDEWVGQGDGAELVPCEDEGAVAAALLGLLRDPDRRRAYGERNARVVREQHRRPRARPRAALPGAGRRVRVLALGIDGADYDLVSSLDRRGADADGGEAGGRGLLRPAPLDDPRGDADGVVVVPHRAQPGRARHLQLLHEPEPRDAPDGERGHPRRRALLAALGAAGLRSAFVTVPFTYPAEPMDGIVVTGYGGPEPPEVVPAAARERIFAAHPGLRDGAAPDGGALVGGLRPLHARA